MSQVSDSLLGLTLDEGSGFFVRESAQSENGVASITSVLLQTYKFIGSQMRTEYLMPQMTQMNWALRAFENHIPDCKLILEEALAAPEPATLVQKFDELMQLASGSSAAPCLRVIPGTCILQNAYRSAESISDGLHGQYQFDGFVKQKGGVSVYPTPITPVQLAEFGCQMAAHWVAMFDALDLEAMAHLKAITDQWIESGLGLNSTVVTPEDAAALMRSMCIYSAMPDWADHNMDIDPATGSITVDGVVNPQPTLIRDACPDSVQHSYHGGRRPLNQWIIEHNTAMFTDIPMEAVLEHDGPPAPGCVVRDLQGHASVWSSSETEAKLWNEEGQVPPGRLFRVTWRGITEFVYVPNSAVDGERIENAHPRTTARDVARLWHAGRANNGGSGAKTAQIILGLRAGAIRAAAVVPGVVTHLNEIADTLENCPVEEAQTIVAIIRSMPAAQTLAEMQPTMDLLATAVKAAQPKLPSVPAGAAALIESMTAEGFTVIGSGRWGPTATCCTALVPVKGRGVAPVVYELNNGVLTPKKDLNVAVVLEEPPSTVYSPVRTMIATALLVRLIEYINGRNTPTGYNFDVYDASNPYGIGQRRPCPRTLLNRQMDRYEQALVHVIDNASVEQMPDVLRAAQKVADARYFLNYLDEVIDSIMDREDWIYMLQSLIIGLMVHSGAVITDSTGNNVVSVDSGVVPEQAARFLFEDVLAALRVRPGYDAAVNAALSYGLQAPASIANAANLTRVIRAEVLFGRARNGLELLGSLLDGSNDLVSNVHVGTVQNLIDVDLAAGLMTALKTVFDRDYLGLIDKVEFEAPWECAEWSTQFGAFAFSVASHPIMYEAVDMAREIAVNSGMAAITSALARVGFEWTEIAPAALRVRGSDQASYVLTQPTPMAGQSGTGVDGFLNNAPIAHQQLKVTVVCPSYDIEAYNLVKAYLTMNTSRTYFVQPVGKDISDQYVLRYPVNGNSLLNLALNDGPGGQRRALLNQVGMLLEKTPALADTALIMPYVAAYLNKTALTRDVAVPQIFEVDEAKSLASTSGVIILPDTYDPALLTEKNGIAITVQEKRSVSTALPWIGS